MSLVFKLCNRIDWRIKVGQNPVKEGIDWKKKGSLGEGQVIKLIGYWAFDCLSGS